MGPMFYLSAEVNT